MNPNSAVSVFLNTSTVDRIDGLAQATHDVTNFIKHSPEEIVEMLGGQGASLNVANADPSEIAKFEAVNALLREAGQPEIKMFGSEIKTEIAEINHTILEAVLDRAREAFKEFFAKVDADQLADEYNTYIAPRQAEFEQVHSWENIGVTDLEDPIRRRVVALLDEVIQDNVAMMQDDVLPKFDDNPALRGQDVSRAVLISMLSNFVRGIYYEFQNPKKVGGLRRLAVDTLNGVGEDSFPAKIKTFLAKLFLKR